MERYSMFTGESKHTYHLRVIPELRDLPEREKFIEGEEVKLIDWQTRLHLTGYIKDGKPRFPTSN